MNKAAVIGLLLLSACGQGPESLAQKTTGPLGPMVGNSYGQKYLEMGHGVAGKAWERLDFISESSAVWTISEIMFDGVSTWVQSGYSNQLDLVMAQDGKVNAYTPGNHTNAGLVGSYYFRINSQGGLDLSSTADFSSVVTLPKQAASFPN